MEFTKENWENAPEGARLECRAAMPGWEPVYFVGWLRNGRAAIETDSCGLMSTRVEHLRIVLPKRKVTVQLWQNPKARSLLPTILEADTWKPHSGWTLVGEHTFEIEGE